MDEKMMRDMEAHPLATALGVSLRPSLRQAHIPAST
jgi:hypothetical protein